MTQAVMLSELLEPVIDSTNLRSVLEASVRLWPKNPKIALAITRSIVWLRDIGQSDLKTSAAESDMKKALGENLPEWHVVAAALAEVCELKSAHVMENWQDKGQADTWEYLARRIEESAKD